MPPSSSTKTQLQLLIAPAGYGKTYDCLKQFGAALAESKNLLTFNHFYIVPSAEHARRVEDLLFSTTGAPILPAHTVTTFDRFIKEHIYEPECLLVTDVLKSLFLREALSGETGAYFRDAKMYPGFVELISELIGEVKDAGFSSGTFNERFASVLEKAERLWGRRIHDALKEKYRAFVSIMRAYERRLQDEGLSDTHDLPGLFRDALARRADYGKTFGTIFVDGFFEFLPLQIKALTYLSACAERVVVTLTADEAEDGRFPFLKRTRAMLARLGFRAAGAIAETNHRARNPSLAHLERTLFSEQPESAPKAGPEIRIFEATGERSEIEMIAREISRLRRAEAYPLHDFCIILRNIDAYGALIRTVFNRYGISVHIHERDRLRSHVLAEHVSSLLKVFADGWKKEAVFNLLYRYPMEGASREVAAWMERYAREQAFEGREAWLSCWQHLEAPQAKESCKAVLQEIAAWEDRFRSARSAEAHIEIVRKLVWKFFPLAECTPERAEQMYATKMVSGLRRLLQILDELALSYKKRGGEEVSFDEFFSLWMRTVEVSLISERPHTKNAVQVYDASLARQKEYEVVFVAGLLEQQFPRRVREHAILKDRERRLLNEEALEVLEEKGPRQEIEAYLFYLSVTRARSRLYLTWPQYDLRGRPNMPSFYLEDVKRCFTAPPETKRMAASQVVIVPEEAETTSELALAVTARLFSEEKSPQILALSAVLAENPDFRASIREIYKKRKIGTWQARKIAQLRDKAILEALGVPHVFSASRLETYAACPFRYFLSEEVALKEPDEEISPRVVGTILHEALEQFFKSGGARLEQEKAKAEIEKFLSEAQKKEPLKGDRRYRIELKEMEMKDILAAFIENDLHRGTPAAKMYPAEFEYEFGFNDAGLKLPVPVTDRKDASAHIRGKIDRIDRMEGDSARAIIVDYKYHYKINARELSLQLPLYVLAAETRSDLKIVGVYALVLSKIKSEKVSEKAAGFFSATRLEEIGISKKQYADVSNLGIGTRGRGTLTEEAFQKMLDEAISWASAYAEGIRNAAFPVYPKDCLSYCKFKPVCRIEPWMIDRIQYELSERKS